MGIICISRTEAQLIAGKNGIHLICLPSSTSHALQPMDVSVFGPTKTVQRNIMSNFYQESKTAGVTKSFFCILRKQLWA